jgi:hypothetical protein
VRTVDTKGLQVKKKVALCPQKDYKRGVKTDLIKIRVSDLEKEGFQEAADLAGLKLSAWARERLRRAAIRELEEASRPIPFIRARDDNGRK